MAEDEERRERVKQSGRRDPARNSRRDPPVIEGQAQGVTATDPIADPVSATEKTQAQEGAATAPPFEIGETLEQGSQDSTLEAGDTVQAADDIASEAAEPQPSSFPEAPPQPAPSNGSSYWGTLAALGFVVLAAGLIYLFYQLSSLPPDNSAAVADLRSRLAAVESRPGADVTSLDERLAKLEHAAGDTQNSLATLAKRVDAIAGTLSSQPNVAGQVADLQTAITGLKTDLASLQSSVAALPRPDVGRIDARLSDLDQRVSSLQGAVSNIPHVDLGPLTSKVDAIEARLKPIEVEVDAARSPQQMAQRRAAPVAVTAQAIVGAIEAGAAFPKELQALQALGTDSARLAPLQAVAENGAPSLRDLQTSLAELRDRIVNQGTAPASGSYMNRLMAGASGLVQVRPLGSVVGDTPSAIVARMNDEIGSDDLTAALADWHKLPESSQNASKALAERIKLRLDAEQAAKDIASNAIGAMASPRG